MTTPVTPTLIVCTAGGGVDEVFSAGLVEATIVDYDTEEVSDEDTFAIPQSPRHTRTEPAIIHQNVNSDEPARVRQTLAALPAYDGPDVDPSTAPVRALIIVSGGVVQNVLTDRPVRLVEVSYDEDELDEADEDALIELPQANGQRARGLADWSSPEINAAEVEVLCAVWTKPAPGLAPTDTARRRRTP